MYSYLYLLLVWGVSQMLNPNQLAAVKDHDGIISVIAGPGSGKTRVLIERVYDLVFNSSKKINPSSILLISFTNKVRKEIKERLKAKSEKLDAVEVHTFHSFAIWALRKHADYVNLSKNFIVLDDEDAQTLMEDVYKEIGLDKKIIKLREMLKVINMSEDKIKQNFASQEATDLALKAKIVFNRLKYMRGYLDFDDLLIFLNKLLKTPISKYYQTFFKYVMIDEAQDLNKTQFEFVNILRNEVKLENLLLVGDLDQAIYEWRGASPDLFYNFHCKAKQHILNINYRSSKSIVDMSKELINNNLNRVAIDFTTPNPAGYPPEFIYCDSRDEECETVITNIKKLIINGVNPSEIAILYRANYISGEFEKALIRGGVQYVIYNGVEFFTRKEIKDTLALVKVINNPTDELSWMRILSNIEGLGKTSLEKIRAIKTEKYMEKIRLAVENRVVSTKLKERLTHLLNLYTSIEQEGINKYSTVANYLVEQLNYEKVWNDAQFDDRIENYQELLRQMDDMYEDNKSLNDFLEAISIYTKRDENKNVGQSIKLMTMHSSKGLEFEHVFIVCATQGIIPSLKALSENYEEGIEQERRLMYVAMTRAKSRLNVYTAPVPSWYGGNYNSLVNISQFVYEAKGGID